MGDQRPGRDAPNWEIRKMLRNCLDAMSTLRDQVDLMSGMFGDEDGTIQEACDVHDETKEAVRSLLERMDPQPRLPFPGTVKAPQP